MKKFGFSVFYCLAGCFTCLAQDCTNWLNLPSNPSFVAIGDLDIPGNQITVEAEINMTLPFGGGPTLGSDIVAKYADPSDANYLLRAQNAQITTTTGFYKTPDACSFELNKTYHVAMVYDGSSLKYYRNGFLVSQIAATGNLIQNNWLTQIGFYQFAFYNTNFIGYINEVRIWSVARTQAQIQAFMNTSLPSPATQTGLLAYYTFDNLLNKQGNPAWNGTLGGTASINQTNPTCASFVPDNICCPVLMGTINGNSICPGKSGTLTFHSTATSNPPYTITYSDGITNYVQNNVQDGVPFPVAVQPSVTTTYSLVGIQDAGTCLKTIISGQSGTINVSAVCDHCNDWLDLAAQPAYVQVGNLNVTGNQITVEAEINRTAPYAIGTLEEGDIVSKHDNPSDVNYLLRPNHAYITTTDGYYGTPDICDIQLNKTYHIAMVYDGAALKFYRNGFLMSQVPATGNLFQNGWQTRIGYYFNQAYNENFIGYINEVRIWNVARTQAQIQAYMNTSLPSPATQTGLLAYYTFDDLINKQGNPAWNGALGGSAAINQTNPTCAAFVPDNECCPKLAGSFTGNSICPGGTGVLTFHPTTTPLSASYTITYSDGITNYVQNNVQDAVPFPVPVQPAATTKYALLKITNPEGCATDITGDTATIIMKDLPQPSFTADQDVCNPFQVDFAGIIQPGTAYDWNINGAAYPNSLTTVHDFGTAGTYPVSLTVTQAGGCVNSLSRNISISLQPSDVIATSDTTICFGDSIRLETKPALEYCWSPDATLTNPSSGSPEVKPLSATQYFLNAKIRGPNLIVNGDFSQGNAGFLSDYTMLTSGNQEGTYMVAGNPASWDPGFSNCADHTGGNGNMLLINGSQTATNIIWSETVPVQPNTNYDFSAWFQLISLANPAALVFSVNGIPLENFYYPASTSACSWIQYKTVWNSGANGNAIITISDAKTDIPGNDFALDDISFTSLSMETEAIRVNVDKPLLLASADTIVCPGASVPLWASGVSSFSWSPADGLSDVSISNPIATPQNNTAYIISGRSSLGCLAKDTVQVSLFQPVPVTITPDTSICMNDAVQLYAAGALAYSWSPAIFLNDPAIPNPVAKPDQPTRFILSYKDMNSCMEKDSVSVSFRPSPVFHAPPDQKICVGFSVLLASANDPNFIYAWSPADNLDNPASPAPSASPGNPMYYQLEISDPVCSSYDSSFRVFVDVKPSPTVIAQKSNDINCSNLFSQLNATGAVSYSWFPAAGLNNAGIANPVAAIDSSTTFVVRGTSENGCYAYDSVTVNVKATGKNLFSVPNAFTPNFDGVNDCFGIRKWGDVTIREFSVYNRWGQRVFDTRTPGDCWNGTLNGIMQDAGQYVYVIQAVSFCGNITRTGTVLLIR